jgi:uncharacterized repeat protein (TIGR02543 family)
MTIQGVPARKAQGPLYSKAPQQPVEHRIDAEEAEGGTQRVVPILDDGLAIPPEQQVETSPEVLNPKQTPGTMVILRDSTLTPPATFSSRVNEPSVGSQGNGIFTTHNWYAEISTNNGSSYTYISPYTLFPNTPTQFSQGFCCDQRVAQDSSNDLIFWMLQYVPNGTTATSSNGDRLAVTHGQAGLTTNTWSYYDLTPGLFGLTGKQFDFPHFQVSANYLYFTTNIFDTAGAQAFYGALVGRIPLSALASGGTATIDAFLTTTYGSIAPVNGAGAEGARPGKTTMYFAAVFSTTSLRVLTWPEANASPTVTSITGLPAISTATFACNGPDGRDPCTRANTRMQTGWITDTELGFMFASAQQAPTRPYPYTRVIILDPSTLTVLSQPDIFSTTSAWLYPALAVNARGHLGGTIDNLGGNVLPTVRAVIRDDFSPNVVTSGWETYSVVTSTQGTAGLWGDFNGATPHELYPNTWLAVGHAQNGGPNDNSSRPHNYWFGRERDASPALTVTLAGTGTGTVTSSPAGINCGATCSSLFPLASTVTLTATPAAFSTFTGWSGACTGTGTCSVLMDDVKSVTATFAIQTFSLTVNKTGTGTGTVTSSPAGINCGGTCSATYNGGTVVTLTAAPDAFVVFTGWSGACTGTGSCVVTMDAAKSVTANFDTQTFNLGVAKTGTGTGTVTSSPAGINCGATCGASFDANTVVTLTATPDAFVTFDGWSGACTGTGSCVVTMDAVKSVTASFTLQTFSLSVSKAGTGTGTVTSSPAGIDCGATCSASFDGGTVVTLTAAPDAFVTFDGWSGACTGTGSCVVTMDAAKSVTATFTLQTFELTVTTGGTGTGTVTSSPAGIDCGATCNATYDAGTVVTLTAAPGAFSIFAGWSGACTGTDPCVVTMDAAKSVSATFSLQTFNLSVAKDGTGTGTVTSSPAGIDCGGTCSAVYDGGTEVTLTAAPDASSDFTGWSGDCTGTGTCVVTMDAAKSVTATFTLKTFTLTVANAGTGTGTVTSSPAGINCGADCSEVYDYNTVVTLTPAAATGSTFTGWSGDCTGTGSCVVTMDQARSVTATFTLQQFTLTVATAGTGSGTVTSSPAGINCGADCSEVYDYNTAVTLTPAAATGSTFTGWSGDCTGTGSCVVTMDQARSVTATFTLQQFTLTVATAGTGSGTVTSSPAGINCGADCSEVYTYNTVVTLTPAAATGSTFTGWSGDCTGTGSCVVTMDQARSVTATFTLQTLTLTVATAGTGSGTVTSSPAGINCGADCSEVYDYNTAVTLTPAAATGSTFTGWSGDCTGTGSCVVTMDQARSVTATFTLQQFTLTVATAGTGSGTVTSSPAGINCGADCSEVYAYNTAVTLTPAAATGSTFTGWSGDCTGTGSCVVTMDQARSVTATFTLNYLMPLNFYTLTPCRVVDTRSGGGGVLTSGAVRIVPVAGVCGVPSDAVAVSINVTAVSPTTGGHLTVFPGNGAVPSTSTLNYGAGQTRANNAVVLLSTDNLGTLAAQAVVPTGQVHLLIDVNGYFKP